MRLEGELARIGNIPKALQNIPPIDRPVKRRGMLIRASVVVLDVEHLQAVPYFGRKIKVIYADRMAAALAAGLQGTELDGVPLMGSMSQTANILPLYENTAMRQKLRSLYEK